MKHRTIRKMRHVSVIFVLCGMAFGIVSPAYIRPRVAAKERQLPIVTAETNTPSAEQVNQQLAKSPVAFEENRGQFNKQVRYMARAAGSTIFLAADEAVYVLPMPESEESKAESRASEIGDLRSKTEDQTSTKMFALRMKLVDANVDSTFVGEQMLEHRTNYFKGSDESKWQTDVPNYGRVRFENVYQGILMVWHGLEHGETRYDFMVEPYANPDQIQLYFDGADSLEIDAAGDLLIHTPVGTIKQSKPLTFQETDGLRSVIGSQFALTKTSESTERSHKQKVSFVIGEYDRSKTLTIDPTVNLSNLAFSTFLGGSLNDSLSAIAVDASGSVYVTGQTTSSEFPTTAGTFDTTYNGGFGDVFVTKLNATGSGLIYSTYLGGSGIDGGEDIAIDSSGIAYLTGQTVDDITDFPTTAGAFNTTPNGSTDVFVTKLNAAGSGLIYSTFIGGNDSDESKSLVTDASGFIYVTGITISANYPTNGGAFNTTPNGADDVFVTKLNPGGSGVLDLTYSTFLGGSGSDFGFGIAIDSTGNAYITGTTVNAVTNFPTTVGAYDVVHNGVSDVFVTKLSPNGASLAYSTFIGGSNSDTGFDIAIDNTGNAHIVGSTADDATDYPTTVGSFDITHNGSLDVFVTKINPLGSGLIYSTFLGGNSNDFGLDTAVDSTGNVYITGETLDGATDYPTTATAFDQFHNGSRDAFMTKLNTTGSSLVYSTFLGGSGNDRGNGIAIDGVGNAYLAGNTIDDVVDFPTTTEAFQPIHAGGNVDAFVSRLGDWAIAGRVIDPTGGPLANVMIALSGQVSNFMITGVDGRFGFLDTVTSSPYTVTATRSGYSINPALYNISSLNNNRELIFVGQPGSPTGGIAGTLRFANLSYSKGENGASVTATVERTGNVITTEPITVDFNSTNGTAIAGQDFVQTNGVLTFQFGENSKTITVPLLNDGILEPRENFGIVLSNPTNTAEIDPNRASTNVQILDEDLSNGDLLISEFRLRGRLGANDEYVKLFNPNPFDVTVFASDASAGLTLAREKGMDVTSVLTIPNFVSIPAHGHFLLTNNSPAGGFSLIDYPTGTGSTTAVGDLTFAGNIPDNSDLVLVRTANPKFFNAGNLLDAVGFGASTWTTEGTVLSAIAAEDSESCFVRRLTSNGLQDTNNNRADFLLVDNHAMVFGGIDQSKVYSALGAPAPETSESLRLMMANEVGWVEFQTANGVEVYDPAPIPNGPQGTLTLYRRITNYTNEPMIRLRLRVIDFPTAGSESQRRYSSRPDFRILSSLDESQFIKGATLAADRLQPNGGGINSTLTVDAITQSNPLQPGASVVIAIRLGVVRYGRHPFQVAFEAMQ